MGRSGLGVVSQRTIGIGDANSGRQLPRLLHCLKSLSIFICSDHSIVLLRISQALAIWQVTDEILTISYVVKGIQAPDIEPAQ